MQPNEESNSHLIDTPVIRERSRIVVLDDVADFRMLLRDCLIRRGYDAVCYGTADRAKQGSIENPFHAAVVDGNLGDGYGEEASSGQYVRFCEAHGVPYIRYSNEPDRIPLALRGERCTDSFQEVMEWILANIPIYLPLQEKMGDGCLEEGRLPSVEE